jgi:hypothetical protein
MAKMDIKGKMVSFPAQMLLSFSKLLDSLESEVKENKGARSKYIKSVLEEVNKFPGLRTGLEEADLESHQEVINDLMSLIFPESLTLNEIKCACLPWHFKPFYASKRLLNLEAAAGGEHEMDLEMYDEDAMYIAACATILGMHYGLPIKGSRPFYMKIPDSTGRIGHYRMAMNADFMDVYPSEKAPEITQEDYHELVDNFNDIELWKKKFPEGSWVFSGFMLMNLMDLTVDKTVENISSDLLNGGPEGLINLENNVSDLLKIPNLTLSFVSLQGDTLIQGGIRTMTALMMGNTEESSCKDMLCPYTHEELIKNDRPVAFPDVDKFVKRSNSTMAKNLGKSGMKSYFVTPILYNGKKLGFLELGSKSKGVLNTTTYLQLEQVIPILAVSGNRFHQEFNNRVEAVIQEECTTIHSSVKWRFEKEAFEHIKAEDIGETHVFTDLVFKDVYPLYGQLDIRGSSTIRNEAVKSDLKGQLKAIRKVVLLAQELEQLPIYDELIFVVDDYLKELESNMNSTSEHIILNFLEKEIEPLFPHLSLKDENLALEITTYQKSVNNQFHILYKERKKFDDSVNTMNKVLAAYIDEKQDEAQAMFPHYFERYKTDGVEFNMYIGESIAPERGFSQLLVKNLRLWQLMVMVEMEREFHELRKTLKKRLDIASLILAYNNPLAIHFRMDEKRFDVDGAYNARYEIIKKRIDKAHIKGTNERITAPEKMVVIYTNEEVEREYLRYFRFLQSKGYLANEAPEILDVEELQGVSGLKALRISIDYAVNGLEKDISMEDIMQEIEGKGKKAKA